LFVSWLLVINYKLLVQIISHLPLMINLSKFRYIWYTC